MMDMQGAQAHPVLGQQPHQQIEQDHGIDTAGQRRDDALTTAHVPTENVSGCGTQRPDCVRRQPVP